jgi:hypothetical protein
MKNLQRSLQAQRRGGDKPAARRRSGLLVLAASAAALALPAAAQAAGAPKATTGTARNVSYASAVLAGAVNPNGNNTSYYFQYGPTKAYGSQTGISDAGSGTSANNVRLSIAGLQPITIYHYRLVAVNSAGVSLGSDRTLKTEKVPLSLAILAAPNPVPFGGSVTIQGTLSGTGNASRSVVLQENAFPFTAGYQSIGNTELTTATGEFKFVVQALTTTASFRVFTPTSTPVISPATGVNVAVRVSSHVARTKRRGFARIYGTVTPAVNGAQVGMLRIAQGHGILAGGTIAKPKDANSSQFSRVVRVKKGAYRVLVKVAPGAVISAYGTPLLIR